MGMQIRIPLLSDSFNSRSIYELVLEEAGPGEIRVSFSGGSGTEREREAVVSARKLIWGAKTILEVGEDE